jgi:hypothetical protein
MTLLYGLISGISPVLYETASQRLSVSLIRQVVVDFSHPSAAVVLQATSDAY